MYLHPIYPLPFTFSEFGKRFSIGGTNTEAPEKPVRENNHYQKGPKTATALYV